MEYYRKSVSDSLQEQQSSAKGLTSAEVQKRLEKDGYNEIKGRDRDPLWKLFLENFKDPMVVVLLIAAAVQIFMGHVMESLIIFLVLILNAVISVIQTRKAESSLAALQQMSAPEAKVLRDGAPRTVPARELVRGDIVILEAGDFVPADGRIIESGSLKINEGMLTGESEAVEKHTDTIDQDAPLGDRRNMAFSGSLVVYGRGVFLVTGTALTTEIGKIAELLESAEAKQTPLQRKLEAFSKQLGIGILILSVIIFGIQAGRVWLSDTNVDTTEAIFNALMFAVAVAVAAIPEALSSIVTIVLSVGTNKMAKQNAIIRKLPAVEALGSAGVICTDKTGTLTQNKMTVVDYYLPEGQKDQFKLEHHEWSPEARRLLHIAVLCNDSNINEEGKELGDPTEVALIAFSNSLDKNYQEIRDNFPREAELPFDSERKLMSTLHTFGGQKKMITKGGPDVLFSVCSHVLIDEEEVPFTEELRERFIKVNEDFSSRALRVLAYAYKTVPNSTTQITLEDEKNLVLVGLTAMIDPPREAVYSAIAESKNAGIRTIMITGDHKTTAQAIGRDIGLMSKTDIAITGQELDAMSDAELDNKLEQIGVYARVSPENKIRIVRAWQRKGKITAMTGDGVNDAPALKQADIGVAMGSGTDVAKDAAAMILTDDNFVSIVNAVSVGRTVFDNIKKAIAYLFSGNLGAIIAILFALIFDWINPFTAIQLLFINLANDSLPAIALGMEKAEPNVMSRKPRELNEGIFSGGLMQAIITRGVLIGAAVIVSLYLGLQHSEDMGVAMAFTTLILSRTLQTFAARSNTQTSIEAGFFSNKYVIGAVLVCFAFYGVAVLPGIRQIFSIPDTFGMSHWLTATGLAVGAVILMELTKLIRRAFSSKPAESARA
ncbi:MULTISPECIES: cation-translocating P-type ATPase [unclassified Paenibacillus]|uniref:cation-translocating P-type ATPase n=1 Tax=unclassified Paenibacillus TaxID=185978 RepID=UPI002404B37A|nr:MULTISPECIES: cation-translocating P-type ATPase [unclassified Paenibacillus]MDF9841669.1 Ca2+-transporting ATPase [Paenibacillus sp. PastF-2]MDF9848219.1 Ca2+-transporting ATPase [Paenibacillus sp. PastM-2]MDF9854828.1 Ca2+-transporting ATPase [Paenibacillus sp. PastF-1]MDH6480098.1 Ca2+-transporting ATPase [Paenibacillus sp. PastH-2]MDH6507531.1 Ca2+-transporting ATPase [Paenibacillus sp. PastM-3]